MLQPKVGHDLLPGAPGPSHSCGKGGWGHRCLDELRVLGVYKV